MLAVVQQGVVASAAVCCSVLQCVAVCCGVLYLQDAVCRSRQQYKPLRPQADPRHNEGSGRGGGHGIDQGTEGTWQSVGGFASGFVHGCGCLGRCIFGCGDTPPIDHAHEVSHD